MEAWEAVQQRFDTNEASFRESWDEHRELLAFWVEGDDVGGDCLRGVDFWNAGGIDTVVALNRDFLRTLVACIAADVVGGKDPGEFAEVVRKVQEVFSDDGLVEADENNVMHPTEDFDQSSIDVEHRLQAKSLSSLLKSIFSTPSTSIELNNESGGASLAESEWTNNFVWSADAATARREIDANVANARKTMAAWIVSV